MIRRSKYMYDTSRVDGITLGNFCQTPCNAVVG